MKQLFLASGLGIVVLILVSLRYYKGKISEKEFAIVFMISLLLTFSPVVYLVLFYIGRLLGFYYSFVAIFFFSILLLFALNIYLLLSMSNVTRTFTNLWQEIALMKHELEENKRRR
jgi:hypothetical protein